MKNLQNVLKKFEDKKNKGQYLKGTVVKTDEKGIVPTESIEELVKMAEKAFEISQKKGHLSGYREKDVLQNLQQLVFEKHGQILTVDFFSKENSFQMVINTTKGQKAGDITG